MHAWDPNTYRTAGRLMSPGAAALVWDRWEGDCWCREIIHALRVTGPKAVMRAPSGWENQTPFERAGVIVSSFMLKFNNLGMRVIVVVIVSLNSPIMKTQLLYKLRY